MSVAPRQEVLKRTEHVCVACTHQPPPKRARTNKTGPSQRDIAMRRRTKLLVRLYPSVKAKESGRASKGHQDTLRTFTGGRVWPVIDYRRLCPYAARDPSPGRPET